MLALEDQLARQQTVVGVPGLADGPARWEEEADHVLAGASGRIEHRHRVGPIGQAGRGPRRLHQVARRVHQGTRPTTPQGSVLRAVGVVRSVPGVVAEHRPAPLGSLPRLAGRGKERVATGQSGEGFGRQHLALRPAGGGRVRGERDRPRLPGVAEVAAQGGQARSRRVDRAAETAERRVDETRGPSPACVPVPDRGPEAVRLPRALRAEIAVRAEGERVAERVGGPERLEAGDPVGADALRVHEQRAALGVVVAPARPHVEHDTDAPAVGPLEDEQRGHVEAAPLGVVLEEGHGQPAHAGTGQQAGDSPRERGQLRVVRHVDRDAPRALEAAGGVERPQEGLLALKAPQGVVQERAEGDPALAQAPHQLVAAGGVVLEERQGLVRDGHRVAVAVPLRLGVRARHGVEVGAHELGHVPSGGRQVEAPGGVGARVVHDVHGPGRRGARGRTWPGSAARRRRASGDTGSILTRAYHRPSGAPREGKRVSLFPGGTVMRSRRLAPTFGDRPGRVPDPGRAPGARSRGGRARADIPGRGRAGPDRRGRDR